MFEDILGGWAGSKGSGPGRFNVAPNADAVPLSKVLPGKAAAKAVSPAVATPSTPSAAMEVDFAAAKKAKGTGLLGAAGGWLSKATRMFSRPGGHQTRTASMSGNLGAGTPPAAPEAPNHEFDL
jgi:hypothetical protein